MLRWIRRDEQVVQNKYLDMLESELAYYRGKADSERNRADRLNDSLLVRSGEMPVTDLGVGDQRKVQEDAALEFAKRAQELNEIYGEAMEEIAQDVDGNPIELPAEVAEEAKKLVEP